MQYISPPCIGLWPGSLCYCWLQCLAANFRWVNLSSWLRFLWLFYLSDLDLILFRQRVPTKKMNHPLAVLWIEDCPLKKSICGHPTRWAEWGMINLGVHQIQRAKVPHCRLTVVQPAAHAGTHTFFFLSSHRKETERQLSDAKFYQLLTTDSNTRYQKDLRGLMKNLPESIHEQILARTLTRHLLSTPNAPRSYVVRCVKKNI